MYDYKWPTPPKATPADKPLPWHRGRSFRWWVLLALPLVPLLVFVGAFVAVKATPATPLPKPDLVRYEDGSGVLYIGNQEVATYPADTFVWHCATMGNRVCGGQR